jgi:hypothetical protein
MAYLVDTNILVDVTRGSMTAADYLDSLVLGTAPPHGTGLSAGYRPDEIAAVNVRASYFFLAGGGGGGGGGARLGGDGGV